MKKLILSFAITCVAAISGINQLHAQSATPRVGMKAGLTYMTLGSAESSVNGVNFTAKYDFRPGFQGGLYAELPVANGISFVPQALYTQKGGNATVSVSGITATVKTQISYLDVPLLAGFKVQDKLTFYAGPQVAFLLSQTTTATASNGTATNSASNSDTDGLRKSIFGGNLGAGYKFTDNVGLNIHYLFDFSRAADDANDTGEKNSGFALTFSYLF